MAERAMTTDPVERLLRAIERATGTPQRCGERGEPQWEAVCPSHEDSRPSLRVSVGDDGRALLHCLAGCAADAVCAAVGLSLADLMPPADRRRNGKGRVEATYDYRDETGTLLFQVVRYEGKQFAQRKPDGNGGWLPTIAGCRRVIYRLPEIRENPTAIVVHVEGEKDCDALAQLGVLATCNSGGAGKWRAEHSTLLAGRRVVIVPDADEPGRKHAQAVAESLRGIATVLGIVELPGCKDAAEWVEKGGTKAELRAIFEQATAAGQAGQAGQADQATDPPTAALAIVRVRGRRGRWDLISEHDGLADVRQERDGTITVDTVPFDHILRPSTDHAFRLAPVSYRQLLDRRFETKYLVENVLLANQPCIIGGPSKALKTTLSVDLAVSLASGTPFLGHFATVPSDVLFLTGESGAERIQLTVGDVAKAKNIDVNDLPLRFDFSLPQIGNDTHLDELERCIDDRLSDAPSVLLIDPIYLAMQATGDRAVNMASLFESGPLLRRLTAIGEATGTTIIILHHVSKFAARSKSGTDEPMELEDLSQSGFAEWARQWLLLSRRTAYVQGSGRHELYCNVGGSMGHSGLYAVDVDEGAIQSDFSGTTWEVTVRPAQEARADRAREREAAKAQASELRDREQRVRVMAALRDCPEGETRRVLRERCAMTADALERALAILRRELRVEDCLMQKNGKGKYPGVRLANNQTMGTVGNYGKNSGESH